MINGACRNSKHMEHKIDPIWHHDDVIKWKHFPRYWPFVRGIHRPPVNSPHKGQWRGALLLSLICAWINGWVNNREAGDFRRHRGHCDITVMTQSVGSPWEPAPFSKLKFVRNLKLHIVLTRFITRSNCGLKLWISSTVVHILPVPRNKS